MKALIGLLLFLAAIVAVISFGGVLIMFAAALLGFEEFGFIKSALFAGLAVMIKAFFFGSGLKVNS